MHTLSFITGTALTFIHEQQTVSVYRSTWVSERLITPLPSSLNVSLLMFTQRACWETPPLVMSNSQYEETCNDCVCVCAGCAVKDYGNLTFEDMSRDEPMGLLKSVRAVGAANQKLSQAVRAAKEDGHTAVVLGGDHRSVHTGTGSQDVGSRCRLSIDSLPVCVFRPQPGDRFHPRALCGGWGAERRVGGCSRRHQHAADHVHGEHPRAAGVLPAPRVALKGDLSNRDQHHAVTQNH